MPQTVASFKINYPLIWNQGEVQVRVPGGLLTVRYERRWVEAGDHGLGGFQNANGVEMLFDRHGRVAYSAIEIEFPEHVDDVILVRGMALYAINRLLQTYRLDLMQSHWQEAYVEPLSDVDLFGVTIRTRLDDGTWDNTFQFGEQLGGGLQLARIAEPSEDARTALITGQEPPISFALVVEARRHFIYGNYRMAVVEANTAVESIVLQAIGEYYRHIGRPEEQISNVLEAGLKNLMEHHLALACGETPFHGSELHEQWLDRAYDLRNRVVHRGASAQQDESFEAIRACQRAVYWIASHADWLFANTDEEE